MTHGRIDSQNLQQLQIVEEENSQLNKQLLKIKSASSLLEDKIIFNNELLSFNTPQARLCLASPFLDNLQYKLSSLNLDDADHHADILALRKKRIDLLIKKISLSNHNLLKIPSILQYIIIKEIITDFCENLIFYEKHALIKIIARKEAEIVLSNIVGQKELFKQAYRGVEEYLVNFSKSDEKIYETYFDYTRYIKEFNFNKYIRDVRLMSELNLKNANEEDINNIIMDLKEELVNKILEGIHDLKEQKDNTFLLVREEIISYLKILNQWLNECMQLVLNGFENFSLENYGTDKVILIKKTFFNDLKILYEYAQSQSQFALILDQILPEVSDDVFLSEKNFNESCKSLAASCDRVNHKWVQDLQLKDSAMNLLKIVIHLKENNEIQNNQLPVLTKTLLTVKKVVDQPLAKDNFKQLNQCIDDCRGMNVRWKKVMSNVLIGLLGLSLIAASLFLFVTTFGTSAPLSALGMGIGISIGGTAVSSLIGMGLTGSTILGLGITAVMAKFTYRSTKGPIVNALEKFGVSLNKIGNNETINSVSRLIADKKM